MAQNVVEYALKVNTSGAEEGLKSVSDEAANASGEIKSLGESGAKDLQNLTSETNAAATSFQGMSKEAGQLGRGTQQLSRAVGMVSPELGAAMNATAGMAMAVKGLGTVMSSLNPALLAVAAAVGVAAAAYSYFSSESEKAAEAAKKLKDKQDALNESATQGKVAYEKYADAMKALEGRNQATADSLTNLKAEVQMLQGEMTGKDVESLKTAQEIAQFEAKIVQSKREELELIEKTSGSIGKQISSLENMHGSLNKQQETRLKALKTERDSNREKQRSLRQQLEIYELSEETKATGDAMAGTLKVQSSYVDKTAHYWYDTSEGAQKAYGVTVKMTDEIRSQSLLFSILLKLKKALLGQDKKTGSGSSKRNKRRKEAEKKILDIIKAQTKEMERVEKINQRLTDAIIRSEKSIKSEGASILEIQAERLKTQADLLSGSKRKDALDKSAVMFAQARAAKLKLQTDEIDKQIDALREENSLAQLAVVDADRLLQAAEKQAKSKKHQVKSQEAAKEAQDKLIEAQETANDTEIKTKKQILNLEKEKGQLQEKNIEQQGLAQDRTNRQAVIGIKALKKQLESLAGVKPLDPMAAQLDSFDLSAEQIRSKLERLRELNPLDPALADLKKIEEKLPDLRKALEKKLSIEIEIANLKAPIEKLHEAISSISAPDKIVGVLSKTLGEFVGKMAGLPPGIGGAVGESVGGMIGTIAELGKKTPAEIQEEMDAFVVAFERGMEILPKVLLRILPKFVAQLSLAILKGIGFFVLEVLKALGDFLDALFSPFSGDDRDRKEKTPATEKDRKTQEPQMAGSSIIGFRMGGRIPTGRDGLKFTSGTFGGAGLAMLHPNEYVVPSSGQRPQAIDRQLQSMNGSGGMNITINSMMTEYSAVDSLVNKIEQRFKTFGGAKSTLFAS